MKRVLQAIQYRALGMVVCSDRCIAAPRGRRQSQPGARWPSRACRCGLRSYPSWGITLCTPLVLRSYGWSWPFTDGLCRLARLSKDMEHSRDPHHVSGPCWLRGSWASQAPSAQAWAAWAPS